MDNGNFQTVDELVAYLIQEGRCEEEDARRLIEGLTAEGRGGRVMTPESCWGAIVDFGFLDTTARSGWVDRQGKMLAATWAPTSACWATSGLRCER